MKLKQVSLQLLSVVALMSVAHSAFALSCMRPDPVQSCKSMQERKLSPIWANGKLSLKKVISQEENEMNIGGKGAAVADYLFTGSVTDKSGTRQVKDEKVRITTSCAGPWCAHLPEKNSSGYFLLEPNKSGMKLHIGACTFMPFTVTEQQKKEIEACAMPKPVKVPTVKQNKGGSQIYSQRNKSKIVE